MCIPQVYNMSPCNLTARSVIWLHNICFKDKSLYNEHYCICLMSRILKWAHIFKSINGLKDRIWRSFLHPIHSLPMLQTCGRRLCALNCVIWTQAARFKNSTYICGSFKTLGSPQLSSCPSDIVECATVTPRTSLQTQDWLQHRGHWWGNDRRKCLGD